jgi:dihydrofolate synthase/folylpolyglutamate synthase
LKNGYWPGRFEVLSEKPLVIIDGAHNDEGIATLVHELNTRFSDRYIHIVFAALKDKKLEQMIAQLDRTADEITFVSFDYPRAATAEDLLSISSSTKKSAVDDWESYLMEELPYIKDNAMIVITGSLYFISKAKPYLCKFLKNMTISL